MPELPEVETISKALDKLVRGRTISTASLLRQRLAPDISPASFAKNLRQTTINFVHRRGKHILFDLSGGKTLIVHLRMSGRFSLLQAETEDPKFTHAVFHFGTDERLVFDDQRHFGLMKVVKTPKLHEAKELQKLAPEPFSEEFSVEYLSSILKTSKRSLKEFLLDQTKVCGLGNIYAAEAMFAAGIHPAIAANKVPAKKAPLLYAAIRDVLRIAIAHAEGLPVNPEDLEGGYFSAGGTEWMVYDREKEPCRNCNTPIVRLKQGGRSTYFCRKCQRK
ncbi:MAG: bifunctional DNA-formamidopyrimidine glycosylase/DNA-(apurinic or apyrimidinic site) lyase [Chloracidobacterium sp.]|nr:bifunctional DNA-formamidopyrimidine glycosylase/DNA-(apurinic or apyrimidinic site) lyase [Chloracidobacterium sp.]